jgi:very-short-patch-repair endonuclease
VALGPYFADFASHKAKLVIEVDGDTHGVANGPGHDARRDAYLAERGFTVLRFSNRDVLHNPEGVFAVLEHRFAELDLIPLTPTPDPSPQGGGEERAVTVTEPHMPTRKK